MASKKRKKGTASTKNCRDCKFECPYPEPMDGKITFFCEQVVLNKREDVEKWIFNPLNEFNVFGLIIGKVIIPCPGYEKKVSDG